MRKLQIEHAEEIRSAIQQEIERSDESRYAHRLPEPAHIARPVAHYNIL